MNKLFFVVSLSLFTSLAAQAAGTCPQLTGDYCCGISGGDIQNCTGPKRIEQEAIEGGQKYSIYNSGGQKTSEWLADGKARAVNDSFLSGTETITCEGTAAVSNIPDAVLTQRKEAKGYYRAALSMHANGWLTFPANCIFTDSQGHQVYNCGLQTGYGCQKKN